MIPCPDPHEDPDPRRGIEIVWLSTARMAPGLMVETVRSVPVDPEIGYTTSSPGELGSW